MRGPVKTFARYPFVAVVCSVLISSCGSSTVHANFVNKGEVNYDLQLLVKGQPQTTACSNIAPGDSCDFSMPIGAVGLVAQPIPNKNDFDHLGVLNLNVQDHPYTFVIQTDSSGRIYTGHVITNLTIQGQSQQGQSEGTQSQSDGSSGPAEFDSEDAAQAHCPDDTVVWLNTRSGVYHLKGERWYGNTEGGAYVCQQEADAAGDRQTENGQ